MSANVQSMVYVNEVPWHQLGTRIPEGSTMELVLQKSGLDFQVKKTNLYLSNDNPNAPALKTRFAVVRTDTFEPLGVVGRQYTPVQNKDGFKPFEELCGAGGAQYHTAGVLGSGERVWILAQMPDNIELKGGDIINKFLLFTNSHDGSSPCTLAITPIRVVCENTLRMAIRSAELSIRVIHKRSASERLIESTERLGLINATYKQAQEIFEKMSQTAVTKKKVLGFLEDLFPQVGDAEVSPQTERKRTHVLELVEAGKGQQLQSARGTVWGLYNAVTEYADHVYIGAGDQDRKLRSMWFGGAANLKEKAFILATKMLN